MSSSTTQIRAAKVEDLPILKSFEQAVIAYERPYAPNLKEDPISYYDIKHLIEREDADIIVATKNDKIIGSGYSLIKDSKPYKKYKQYAYLGFMFVLPEYRGQGVNGLIMKSLIEKANARHVTEIELDVYAENQNAINAYKKVGFKSSILNMRFNTKD